MGMYFSDILEAGIVSPFVFFIGVSVDLMDYLP